MPRFELRSFSTFSKSFLLIPELISTVTVFRPCTRFGMYAPDSILFSVTMLTPLAPRAERLELEVLRCQAE